MLLVHLYLHILELLSRSVPWYQANTIRPIMPVPSLISQVNVALYAVAVSSPTPILSKTARAASAPDIELQNA